MVCHGCGKESSEDFSFCPHCGKQRVTPTVYPSCAEELSAQFSFCPHCGRALVFAPPCPEPPPPLPEVEAVEQEQTNQQEPTESSKADHSNEIGTYVFGSFAVMSLVVSLAKGIVPIYIFESVVWAGAAWYWHRNKTHSELAKAIVIVIAALIAIGEVIQVARQFGAEPKDTPAASASYGYSPPTERYPSTYQSPAPPPTGALSTPDVGEIEQQAVALYKQKNYADARPLFDQACDGGEMKACNYLGYLYAKGLGGAHDTKKARDVYQKACDQGTLSSCASLGSLYQDAGSNEEARKYFNKACQGGVAEACGLLRGVE